MDAIFLNHYDRELSYLRELGGEFASQFPKLANRLGMNEFSCADPFVERLLEGFAFMAARVQRRLDGEFPQFTRALIDTIFPHYARPIPSAGIFQLQPDVESSSLVSGYMVPKGTRLLAQPAHTQQTACRFDTTSDLTLWPIRIVETEFFTREGSVGYPLPKDFHARGLRTGLRMTLESTGGVPLRSIKLDRLRIHLRGGELARNLHETLVAHSRMVALAADRSTSRWRTIAPTNVTAHGFEDADALLPDEPRSFSGYRLLQEYFLLAEKFQFIEIAGLGGAIEQAEGNILKLVLGFDNHEPRLVGRVNPDHLALHCVPGVNLFHRRADRVLLDHAQEEHHLVVDRSRPVDYEVWSIDEIVGHATSSSRVVPYLPLYAPPAFDSARQRHATYFTTERRPRVPSHGATGQRSSTYLGTELFLTITDSHQEPFRHQVQQLSCKVLCTNRDLPLFPPEAGWREAFSLETGGPVRQVLCISGPTAPKPPMMALDGETAWRLISHLTPNYLSLQDNVAGGAAMLRELLSLYCSRDDHVSQRQIEGILSIRSRPIVRRLPMPGPLTHGRGTEIELHCDDDAFGGGGAFLLGCVLEQFFARYVTINSFAETALSTVKRGAIHRWPVRLGTMPLI